jgi:hypothetical protein
MMMAKINIEFDTIEKICVVTIDGKKLPDVIYASIYKYYDGKGKEDSAEINVETRSKTGDDGITKRTSLYASENWLSPHSKDEAQEVVSIDELETYAQEQVEQMQQSVASWLSKDE